MAQAQPTGTGEAAALLIDSVRRRGPCMLAFAVTGSYRSARGPEKDILGRGRKTGKQA